MGYTNKTSHYDLPQWIAGDKPSWLGDVNTAMLNIDTAIAGADASASAAESSAAAANAQVQAQEAKIAKNTTDIQALTENLADTQGEVNTVKTTAEGALPKSGGTMTGNLILNAAPTSDLQAATKKYVDDNSGKGALMLSGGTMTGPLILNGNPTTDLGAATKQYVDGINPVIMTRTSNEDKYQVTGYYLKNVLVVLSNGVLDLTSGSVAAPTFGRFAGNPFNLTLNTPVNLGTLCFIEAGSASLTGMTTSGIRATYNGQNTVIDTGATLPAKQGILLINMAWAF